MKRVVGKIIGACSRISTIAGMIRSSGKLPEISEAIAFLQSRSPDLGGSCWIDCGFEHEERSLSLSVIVPAYNVEQSIVSCLESVLRQKTSFDFETIVIDDGSTDGTSNLLKQYQSDPRVCILSQQNEGLSAARNRGILCSKGEYLCFVDSDDELPEGALETLVTTAKNRNAKLVIGSHDKCLRNGSVQYTKRLNDGEMDILSLPGFAHGRIIHHSVFHHLRFPEGYWYEDSIMAQIVHPMCRDAISTVSAICYKYYSNEAGISATSKGNKKSLDSLWITMRLLSERDRFGLTTTQASYEHFLSSVKLTYDRTKDLGVDVARCVFVVQRMLHEQYYCNYNVRSDHKKRRVQNALRANNFRKYVLACELKR